MIYVIGDSHTRSFSFNENFVPLFLGQGKEINFTCDENFFKIKNATLNLLTNFNNDATLIFFIGEPDTRFYLNVGWYPWDNIEKASTQNYIENISKSVFRYNNFLAVIKQKFNGKIFVLNIIPSNRKLQNVIVDEYNKQLKSCCISHDIIFLDVNNDIYIDGHHEMIKEEFISDPVHLNNKLQVLVQNSLIKYGLKLSNRFNESIKWDNSEVQKKFYFDEKFGCYKMKKEIGTHTLSDITFKKSNIDDQLIISKLHEFGVMVIEEFTEGIILQNLKEEFSKIMLSDTSGCIEIKSYSLGKAAFMTRNEDFKNRFPVSYQFFDNPFMQTVTNKFLGSSYTANQKIYAVKDVVGNKHHANDLHFDVQRTLKFFLYLTDTSSKNGAFRTVPGSHIHTQQIRKQSADKISYENREFSRKLPFGPEHTVSVDGKAGSLIIFDTDVFHQAGTVSEGERWVMRGQTEPEPSTISKTNTKTLTLFQRLKNKLFK